MTKLGKKQHQKRLSAPTSWPVARKGSKWIPKILPGGHNKEYGMPLLILLRDVLKVAASRKEVKYVLEQRFISVDGKVRSKENLPVGHMDVVYISSMDKAYRIQLHTSHKLIAKEISGDAVGYKICKVTGKRNIRGGNTQVSLYDGRNILLEKGDKMIDEIRPLGSIKITLPDQEIKEILPLEEGARAMVTEGRHQGRIGKILEITTRYGAKASEVILEDEEGDNDRFTTALDYIYIISSDLELDR